MADPPLLPKWPNSDTTDSRRDLSSQAKDGKMLGCWKHSKILYSEIKGCPAKTSSPFVINSVQIAECRGLEIRQSFQSPVGKRS
jgi:hypothetical protein